MKRQRYPPFGYQILNGEVSRNPEEAGIVAEIFSRYLAGQSLQQIADWLTQQKVPYSENSEGWEKHKVRRILENSKYCGKSSYPVLVDPNIYENALEIRRQKGTSTLPEWKELRKYMCCPICSSKLQLDLRIRNKVSWCCAGCGIRIESPPPDDILQQIQEQINCLIQHPEKIQSPQSEQNSISLLIGQITQNIRRLLSRPSVSPDEITALILERAQSQYANVVNVAFEPETLRLRQLCKDHFIQKQLDKEFFRTAIRAVFLYADGNIGLRLCNGQILLPEKGENTKIENSKRNTGKSTVDGCSETKEETAGSSLLPGEHGR